MSSENSENEQSQGPVRSGGRADRRAVRSAPLDLSIRPIRPGMRGGNFNPLDPAGVQRIHAAALDALETIGLLDAPESGVKTLINAGAIVGEDGRIRFPRSLVEDMLALAKKDLVLCGRNSAYDLDLSGNRVHYGTAGAAVHVVDVEKCDYRDSTIKDLYNEAHLFNQFDKIHKAFSKGGSLYEGYGDKSLAEEGINEHQLEWYAPVSYTHLTLPTNREV